MAVRPQFDIKQMAGGFMTKLLDNLPKPFSRDPKAQAAILLTSRDRWSFSYMSIRNATLYLQTKPLDTEAYTPEVILPLGEYTLETLATKLRSISGFGYSASVVGVPDGTTAVLLLGFVDYPIAKLPIGATFSPIELPIATARSWKILYPIAQALQAAEQAVANAEDMLLMPFSKGFWLDFWGDWLKIPRLPGMNDSDYVTYLIRALRLPKVNNKAMEDILSTKYGVPVEIVNSGYKQFTANLDASLLPVGLETMDLINQIKAAGVRWLAVYYSRNSEDFKAYFYDRYGGIDFKNSDAPNIAIEFRQVEERFGYNTAGFLLNSDLINDNDMGGGRRLQDSGEMFYNDRNDPSYRAL